MRERSMIGGYRIVERIGSGGMSTVYRAIDAEGRAVALKLLHPELAADPLSRARLRREVAMLKRVKSPYVAQILDAETDEEEIFVVTELIEGPTLDRDVRDSGHYTGGDLVELGQELAAALNAIHDAGILHRDLKPSNVMMGADGPILIDFGIAQLGDDLRMTQTGSLAHTPGFCDPVVIRGSAPDADADWWALAAVLAYAATGRAPFGVGNSPAVMHRVLEGDADLPGLTVAAAEAFRSALSPRRAERISFAELLAVLDGQDDAQLAEPTVTYPPADAEPTRVVPAPPVDAPLTRTSVFDRPEFTNPPPVEHPDIPVAESLPEWAIPPRHARLQVFAASIVVAIFALVQPMESAFVMSVSIVALSWLGGAQRDLKDRRLRNGGAYADDVAGALLRAPLTLLGAILRSAASVAVGAGVGWVTASALGFFTHLQPPVIYAASVYLAMVVAWFMGTNSNGREGARYLMEGIAPTAGYRLFWFAITLMVGLAAVVVVSQANVAVI
ncbi:serine/threonine-protein kinase [Trueperella pyogenes]|uniref:serine/threonine protein kinase n=1 Tax=Trueperella pyogenes TaxID=1661 RepID=UPI00312B4336